MYLLDTNICIYAMNGRFPELARKLLTIHPEAVYISAITVGELEYGAAKSHWGERTRGIMHAFLASYNILPFDEADAYEFGKIRADLAAAGNIIGAYDTMIAAQAVAKKLVVVTHNTGEFSRVDSIKTEDWTI